MSVYTGTVGLQLNLTITDEAGDAVDISSPTTVAVRLEKPSGAIVSFADAAVTRVSAAAGTCYITTGSGDLDQPGTYTYQGIVTTTAGTYPSDTESFTVLESLPAS